MAGNKSKPEGSSRSALQESIRHHVRYSLGKEWQHLSGHDLFMPVALAVRDRLVPHSAMVGLVVWPPVS